MVDVIELLSTGRVTDQILALDAQLFHKGLFFGLIVLNLLQEALLILIVDDHDTLALFGGLFDCLLAL